MVVTWRDGKGNRALVSRSVDLRAFQGVIVRGDKEMNMINVLMAFLCRTVRRPWQQPHFRRLIDEGCPLRSGLSASLP